MQHIWRNWFSSPKTLVQSEKMVQHQSIGKPCLLTFREEYKSWAINAEAAMGIRKKMWHQISDVWQNRSANISCWKLLIVLCCKTVPYLFIYLLCHMNNLQNRSYKVLQVFGFQSIMKTNFERISRGAVISRFSRNWIKCL